MYPLQEKTNKSFAIVSALTGLVLIGLFLVIVIFTKLDIVYYPGLKIALGAAICAVLFSPYYPKLAKEKPQLAIGLMFLINSVYFYVVVDYLGGPLSSYIFLLYLIIIIAFFLDRTWGIVSGVLGLLYIALYYFTNTSADFIQLTTPAISIITISAMSYLVGEEYRKMISEKQSLESQNSNLTSNQSKEEALLSSIADGVYVVDMDRNLTMFNAAAEEMTAWTQKEAIGLKCWTVMNLKNEQDISVCQKDCPALAVWNSGQNVMRNDSCFVKHRGKKSVQISSSYAPIHDSKGRLTGAICVFRDITAEKEVERERTEFISTASHELRTPITAIEGYMELIENEKICKIDDKAKEYLEKARSTAIGMSNLVKNLLSVTKIEEGRVQTNITKFSIHDLVTEVVEGMQSAAKTRGLTLKLVESEKLAVKGEKAVGRSLNVVADREQIKEVLFNLIENGLKFTTEGGVSISLEYDKDFATVCVADTGMGIPADGQKHIFEKFYRYDNSATREVGGTGLGLFITRSIVELFGGSIWLESQVNKGTKFFFTIPRSLD
jgi:PAS domain S-box-containing protein